MRDELIRRKDRTDKRASFPGQRMEETMDEVTYVCNGCGLVARPNGEILYRKMQHIGKCTDGLHDWQLIGYGTRLNKHAREAAEAYQAHLKGRVEHLEPRHVDQRILGPSGG